MDNKTRNRKLNRLMHNEINEICHRYKDECKELGSRKETPEERAARLKKKEYEERRRQRWTLHK